MRRRVLVGAIFCCVLASIHLSLAAQDAGSGALSRSADAGFELQQNYPNPFSSTTRIPFELGITLFEGGQPVVVTMRIFNVLQQLVAYATVLNHPAGDGSPLQGLEYTSPGRYEAMWDAHDVNGRPVAAGIYYVQINVNGRRQTMKTVVSS
jgi:hypothetical protein